MPDYQKCEKYINYGHQKEMIFMLVLQLQPLYARLSAHKRKMKYSSKILFEKYDDVRIELIEYFPCDNKEQLNKKEGEYIRKLDCVNRNIAGRTMKEYNQDKKEHHQKWYHDNKQYKLDYQKEYSKNNKEKIKEWRMQKITCDCGRTFAIDNKARHERSKFHQAFIGASAGKGEASISVPTIPGTNVTATPGAVVSVTGFALSPSCLPVASS
jgi:hypothetical protein